MNQSKKKSKLAPFLTKLYEIVSVKYNIKKNLESKKLRYNTME
jgi:hypothetical protein